MPLSHVPEKSGGKDYEDATAPPKASKSPYVMIEKK